MGRRLGALVLSILAPLAWPCCHAMTEQPLSGLTNLDEHPHTVGWRRSLLQEARPPDDGLDTDPASKLVNMLPSPVPAVVTQSFPSCQCEAGPKGPRGADGPEGPTGPRGRGPTGPRGPSGMGPTGPQGEQGVQGERGPIGPSGGPTGPQGPKGDKGDSGDQGIQGVQGVEGPTGPTGITGSAGSCDLGACDPANITQNVLTILANTTGTVAGPTGPTGPAGTGGDGNGSYIVGQNSTVIAGNGSTVYLNGGATVVDRSNGTYNVLGFRCSGVFRGATFTTELGVGRNDPNNSPYAATAKMPDACGANTTLVGGGCELNCTNTGDYAKLSLMKNVVVPGNIPYTETLGVALGSFVDCAASYSTKNRTEGNCFLRAIPYCCNTTYNNSATIGNS